MQFSVVLSNNSYKSVPDAKNFWSQYTGLGAQKMDQYSTQKFLFLKQIINLICEIYRKRDILNAYLLVKYGMAEVKHGDFMKKIHQLPISRWLIVAFLQTCERWPIQNNLDSVYTWFKTIDFNRKLLLGEKWTVTEVLFVYLFRWKNMNQFVGNKSIGRISKWVLQENKARLILRTRNIS